MRLAPPALGPALAMLTAACGSSESSAPTPASPGPPPGPAEWNRAVTPPSDDEAATRRAACGFAAGALPAETQGASRPNGAEIPVDHVVVLMMENRSFDHYFQGLPGYGQPDVDVAPADFSNPDPQGGPPIKPYHDTRYCFVDTNHAWDGVHQQIADGSMQGFTTTNEGNHEIPVHGTLDMVSGRRAMAYHDASDLPFYYWLASEFAIADRYFSSVPGPTWPNRMFLYAATSFGITNNQFASDTTGVDVLVDQLEKRGVSWKVYGDGLAGMAIIPDRWLAYAPEHRASLADYFADAAAGRLPGVAFLDPHLGASGYARDDEHPPGMAPLGQRLTATIVDALARSPNWPRAAFFLTYDEHGGLYDHVPPPQACAPDDHPAHPGAGAFDRYGVRVPMLVVSPFAKRHFVGHRVYDHTSIVRFIQARFVMSAMSGRDANAEAPWEMFDFAAPPHLTPPEIPIPPEIDPAKLDACAALFE